MELNIENVGATDEDIEEVPFEKVNACDCSDAPRNIFDNKKSDNESLYFNDGKRSIDFVLAWQAAEERNTEEKIREIKRAIFEENLRHEGLELEAEETGDLHFVKIHAPLEVLRRYAEILKLRMPMKEVSEFIDFYYPQVAVGCTFFIDLFQFSPFVLCKIQVVVKTNQVSEGYLTENHRRKVILVGTRLEMKSFCFVLCVSIAG